MPPTDAPVSPEPAPQPAEADVNPRAELPVPWDGVVPWLRGSVWPRRLVPLRVAEEAIRLGNRIVLPRRPGRLDAARGAMEAIVGGTPLEDRIEELSHRYVAAAAEAQEYSWRNWRLEKTPIDGIELLRAAQASSRGTILSLTHYGPLSGRKTILLAAAPMVTVAGEWLFDSWPKGYQGYWYRHTVRLGPYPGVTTLPVRGSREALAAELKAGGTAMIAMDMPGRTTTTYLGKPVEMTTGSARLAVDTDSRILPFSLVPHRRDRWRVLIGEPLLPEDHGSWEALHQATADWHSEVILRAPEYYEDPRRPTGWPEATRDRWPAPAH